MEVHVSSGEHELITMRLLLTTAILCMGLQMLAQSEGLIAELVADTQVEHVQPVGVMLDGEYARIHGPSDTYVLEIINSKGNVVHQGVS